MGSWALHPRLFQDLHVWSGIQGPRPAGAAKTTILLCRGTKMLLCSKNKVLIDGGIGAVVLLTLLTLLTTASIQVAAAVQRSSISGVLQTSSA